MLARLPARLVVLGLALVGVLGCQRSEGTGGGDPPAGSASVSEKTTDEDGWFYRCRVSPGIVAEEVWAAGPNVTGFSIVALDDEAFIASDEGIRHENGEIFIPMDEYPFGLTASDGYLYWMRPTRRGLRYGLYASLGELPTARLLGVLEEDAPYTLKPAPHGVVATADAILRLTLYSQAGAPRAFENCRSQDPWNSIYRVASAKESIVWTNANGDDPMCAVFGGAPPRPVDLDDTEAFAIDDENIYYATPAGSDGPPNFVYRRALQGAEDTLIASAGKVVMLSVYGEHVYWQTWPGRLERAPKNGRDNVGRQILTCDGYAYAVTDEYVYWVTEKEPQLWALMRVLRE